MSELITAMVTIFKDDLSVDYDACCKLAEFLIDNGSDGVVVSGTTGESPTLTTEEKLNLFTKIKECIGDRAQVIAGTGSNCTASTIKLTKQATDIGVDGIMLIAPYYNKPPQEGLYQHFKAAANETDLPVIIYNVPSRTGVNISAETTIRLSVVSNIVATKEASGNFDQIKEIILNTSANFKLYSGDDASTYEIMRLGGDGVISVASHVVGNEIKRMLQLCDDNNIESAEELNNKLLPIFNGLFDTTNPILVKAALELIGQKGGPLRLPLIEATDEERKRLKTLLSTVMTLA